MAKDVNTTLLWDYQPVSPGLDMSGTVHLPAALQRHVQAPKPAAEPVRMHRC
jgi:hypothetical protein